MLPQGNIGMADGGVYKGQASGGVGDATNHPDRAGAIGLKMRL